MALRNLFRKRRGNPEGPAYVTVEDAVAQGIIAAPGYQPVKGIEVLQWHHAQDERGRPVLVGATIFVWPSWKWWRSYKKAEYLSPGAGQLLVEFRDVPSTTREPILDLGPMSTDSEQRVGKALMIDSGQAKRPPTTGWGGPK